MSTAAVDVQIVQDNQISLAATGAWPRFIVAARRYVCVPQFCQDDCTDTHGADRYLAPLAHANRDQYGLYFCDQTGRIRVKYRYVGRDQAADTSLWKLSELRD